MSLAAMAHSRLEAAAETYGCGHLASAADVFAGHFGPGTVCRVCIRIKTICKKVKRDQGRINAGERLDRRSRYYYG